MASTIKVDNVQNQPGTNIVSKCGTDVTLGASGDTVALACGASQTGFGRTGTVDWQTGDIKTATFTAATGKGYFVNTTGGVVTVNLPAGSAGDIVGLKDYAGTWDSNAVTVAPNGSEKIGGGSATDPTLTSEGGAVLLVYVDGTQGWLTTQESVTTSPSGVQTFIVATGGTPCSGAVVDTDYKQHTFTGPGTFTVTSVGSCAPNNVIDYLVIAGGGGGNVGTGGGGAGGGAGGYRESPGSATGCYTVSPRGAAPAAALPVTATGYPVTIGAGGGGGPGNCGGCTGTNSVFSGSSTITSAGGGGSGGNPSTPGKAGGSGGGGGRDSGRCGGSGNTPSTNPAQGFDGGVGLPPPNGAAGAGGGATTIAVASVGNGPNADETGGTGGAGGTSSINGTPTARGGGGGGSGYYTVSTPGPGGAGGGGDGGTIQTPVAGGNGTVNTGGGGGGGITGGTGGSGVVIIRYKFQ